MPTILPSPPKKNVPDALQRIIGTIDNWEYYVSGDSTVVRRRDRTTNRDDTIEYRPSSTADTADPFEMYKRTFRDPPFGKQETGLILEAVLRTDYIYAVVHFPESGRVAWSRVNTDDFSNERETMSCSYESFLMRRVRMITLGDGSVTLEIKNGDDITRR